MSDFNLAEQFNHLVGQEVPMKEAPIEVRGKTYQQTILVDENDPVLAEARSIASKSGVTLRIWLPESMGTCDHNPTRLNMHIEQSEDNKYRVTRFNMG